MTLVADRGILKRTTLTHHDRLVAGVWLVNLALLVALRPDPSDMALANVALAVLIRQQYVINLLFWLATRAPTTWPLRVRWTLGKVYHFGGLHVGAATAATAWFLGFVVTSALKPLQLIVCGILVGIVVTALPRFRSRFHDVFEKAHRFGGWAALCLLWTLFALDGDRPALVVLAVITASIAAPWLRLRRVAVHIDRPSPHVALVRFDHGVTPFAGSSTAVSRSPLFEWHSFANIPEPGRSGFRLTVSRAGDWTGRFIDDAPKTVWVKGIPTAGVANIETLFTRVVYIATGSGIGPCLPHLLARNVPALLVWATRDPRKTYGDRLVDEILAVQPDAWIWDTGERGKPDMVRMALDACRQFDAEAVICISNKKLTWQVVRGVEERGIPAYGAIWDS